LRDTTGDRVCLGPRTSQGDVLCSSRQVGLEPAQGGVRESDGVFEALKEDVMVDSVECCSQIQEDEERWGSSVSRHQQVVCDPDQSCFSAVGGTETGLEFFKEAI